MKGKKKRKDKKKKEDENPKENTAYDVKNTSKYCLVRNCGSKPTR
jgi:hypothetical protein